MAALTAKVDWGQIIGGRPRMEDDCISLSWSGSSKLLLLADGMGGHAGGAEASGLAVKGFADHFIGSSQSADVRQRLLDALAAANGCIRDALREEPALEGMGTCLVGLLFDGEGLRWVSVGDSPLWLFRQGRLERLNENHSVAGELDRMAAEGKITHAEAAASDKRHQLLEALMGQPQLDLVDAPEQQRPLAPGDIVLLATDGVETCSVDELEEALAAPGKDPLELVDDIMARIDAHGREYQDNATVMVMVIGEGGDEADEAGEEPCPEVQTKDWTDRTQGAG